MSYEHEIWTSYSFWSNSVIKKSDFLKIPPCPLILGHFLQFWWYRFQGERGKSDLQGQFRKFQFFEQNAVNRNAKETKMGGRLLDCVAKKQILRLFFEFRVFGDAMVRKFKQRISVFTAREGASKSRKARAWVRQS